MNRRWREPIELVTLTSTLGNRQGKKRDEFRRNNNYQVTMLEGREKCEMKLTKPLKFKTGRRDCKTEEDRKFVTKDHEVGKTILKEA